MDRATSEQGRQEARAAACEGDGSGRAVRSVASGEGVGANGVSRAAAYDDCGCLAHDGSGQEGAGEAATHCDEAVATEAGKEDVEEHMRTGKRHGDASDRLFRAKSVWDGCRVAMLRRWSG